MSCLHCTITEFWLVKRNISIDIRKKLANISAVTGSKNSSEVTSSELSMHTFTSRVLNRDKMDLGN